MSRTATPKARGPASQGTEGRPASRSLAPVLVGCAGAGVEAGPAVIGAKAYGLARMAALGLPVPPAFVIPTSWCAREARLTPDHWRDALAAVESACGLRFGDPRRPLLLSVRSGAAVSMPGMMETLLNVGLSDRTVPGLVRLTGNPRLAWDAYRRLISGYGEVVLGVPAAVFEQDLAAVAGAAHERELDFAQLRELAGRHLLSVRSHSGTDFPQDPASQLEGAIHAVFASWRSDKAATYRRIHHLPDDAGTAVTVQRMVFGNAGGMSGAGVGFSRHPSTGEPAPWVDFLFDAQGEDVVSGRRSAHGHVELAALLPAVWDELCAAARKLEQAFGDMQDFEFTVESSRLFLLQSRNGKRTPQARARIALDLLDEGTIKRAEALRRIEGLDEQALAVERLAAEGDARPPALATATSACAGVAAGAVVLDEAAALAAAARGEPAILVRDSAETSDISAIESTTGLLTARGARTSHAAVVARQLGKVCLVGCAALEVDLARRCVRFDGHELAEGTAITLDGHEGNVYPGCLQTVSHADADLLRRLATLRGRRRSTSH